MGVAGAAGMPFSSPHRVSGRLPAEARDHDRGDLVEQVQPGQVVGIAGIGFDAVPGRALESQGGRYQTADACRGQGPGQTEPGRSGHVDNPDRLAQAQDPVQHPGVVNQ